MFHIHIYGAEAERLAQELKTQFEDIFETTALQVHQDSSLAPESSGVPEKIDPGLLITAVGVVLAIPGFLLAARELRERKDKAEKIEKALAYIQSRPVTMNVQIMYIDARGRNQNLQEAEPADIMAAVEADNDA